MNTGKFGVKAVTFDVWETLLLERNEDNSRRMLARCRNLARVLDEFGVKVSVEQLLTVFDSMSLWLVSVWKSNRDVTHLDQIRFIVEKASKGSVTVQKEWVDELSSAYVSPLFEAPPYLNLDANRVLQLLEDRNKFIGLICNTGMTPGFGIRSFLKNEGVAEYFDALLFSDEVGVRKPDSVIFHMAVQRLGVKPYEAVHVGDNLISDVWGAKNAGFKAIHLSTKDGRDMIAESDPNSLISISRKLDEIGDRQVSPDKIVPSLNKVTEAIEELEKNL